MVQGRKSIAPEIHEAKGSYRKNPQRRNKKAPKPDPREPLPPDFFNKDELSKWYELVGDLRDNGVLSHDTREAMIAYCVAFGGWIKARRAVNRTGIVLKYTNSHGEVDYKRNPFSLELHKYREIMNRLLPEFGLTPASRGKLISMKDPDEESPFNALLARMSGNN